MILLTAHNSILLFRLNCKGEMKADIQKYYDDLAIEYDSDRFGNSYGQYIHRQETAVLDKYLNIGQNQTVLDLACGTGRFLSYATHGLDVSQKMVEVAKEKFPDKNIIQGDGENLPYSGMTFDSVISFHLFMHLNEGMFVNMLNEVHRVCKNDGIFIFDIPSTKRRKLLKVDSGSWHGANKTSVARLQELIKSKWKIRNYHGTAFLPIHRIPDNLRENLTAVDSFFGRSLIKEYSSHLIFILEKI